MGIFGRNGIDERVLTGGWPGFRPEPVVHRGHVTLIDATGAAPVADATVLIRGSWIEAADDITNRRKIALVVRAGRVLER